jgi:hypothetical protein
MNSLIDKIDFITKDEYDKFKEKYTIFQAYTLGNYVMLTQREDSFFSIYCIANYFKRSYKKSQLFLLVSRHIDEMTKDIVSEFFIFNTVNIFDKSLTSKISIKKNELVAKQSLVNNMIRIALKLMDTNKITVVMGANIKQHEIEEYIEPSEIKKILFVRISPYLKSIKILEPSAKKLKRFAIMLISILLTVQFLPDALDMLTYDYKQDLQRETRKLTRKSNNFTQDIKLKQQENMALTKELKFLNTKSTFNGNKK